MAVFEEPPLIRRRRLYGGRTPWRDARNTGEQPGPAGRHCAPCPTATNPHISLTVRRRRHARRRPRRRSQRRPPPPSETGASPPAINRKPPHTRCSVHTGRAPGRLVTPAECGANAVTLKVWSQSLKKAARQKAPLLSTRVTLMRAASKQASTHLQNTVARTDSSRMNSRADLRNRGAS